MSAAGAPGAAAAKVSSAAGPVGRKRAPKRPTYSRPDVERAGSGRKESGAVEARRWGAAAAGPSVDRPDEEDRLEAPREPSLGPQGRGARAPAVPPVAREEKESQ